MNSFYERFFVHRFCYVLPFLRLDEAEHDAWSAQWCLQSSGQQVFFRVVGPMDVIIPPRPGSFYEGNGLRYPPGGPQNQGAGHSYACGGPLSCTLSDRAPFGVGFAPWSGFQVLSDYITRRGDAYTAGTGLPFPRPIPTRDQFDATWKSLTAQFLLSPPVECVDPPSSGRC